MNDNEISALYYLYGNENATTTEIAKAVFDPEGERELRNADRKVRHYLEDNNRHLVNIEKVDGKKRFSLKEDSVWFGLGRIDLVSEYDEEVILGIGEAMVYENEEGGYSVATIREK